MPHTIVMNITDHSESNHQHTVRQKHHCQPKKKIIYNEASMIAITSATGPSCPSMCKVGKAEGWLTNQTHFSEAPVVMMLLNK